MIACKVGVSEGMGGVPWAIAGRVGQRRPQRITPSKKGLMGGGMRKDVKFSLIINPLKIP